MKTDNLFKSGREQLAKLHKIVQQSIDEEKLVVENHDGFIMASSEPGEEARFDIYFPA